jgi:hypothetical protein
MKRDAAAMCGMMHVVQDRDQWWALVSMVMNLRVLRKAEG